MHVWLRTTLALVGAVLLFPHPSARAQVDGISIAAESVPRIVAIARDEYGSVKIGTGSGFAVSRARIVTNAHVVEAAYYAAGGSAIGIIPSNARKPLKARVIGFDRDKDMALLQVDGANFRPVTVFGGVLRKGAPVVALGYPGNVDELTDREFYEPQPAERSSGNFSNMHTMFGIEAMSHTASIAHGSSGGPLLDVCGRVLGINTLVTNNSQGDASFGGAISSDELRAFLRRQGQDFAVVDNECVPPEVAASRAAAAKAQAELDAAKKAMAEQQKAEDERRRTSALVQEERENYLALAALLLVAAGLAAAYGLAQLGKEDRKRQVKLAGAAAALLLFGAVGVYLNRPVFRDGQAVPPAPGASDTGAAGADPSAAPLALAGAPARSDPGFTCTIDEGSSNYTLTVPKPVDLSISDSGCVNRQTQYAASGNGAWQRVAVPKSEDVVSRFTFDPETRTYTHDKWYVDADVMQTAREIKDRVASQACTISEDARTQLAQAQREVVNEMLSNPDERLVYRCKQR